jgi:hypothetical protein
MGNAALSYQVNFAFGKTQQHGQGFAAAFSNNKTASTGVIGVDRFWNPDQKKMYLLLAGKMTANPFNALPICVIVGIGPTLDRIDLDSTTQIGVFGVNGSGACDTDKVYGYGYLQ